ncbi:HAAS signaling domain-containing protein [Microbacterium sp. RG1]|uniref:HAAS signaling domain-containing protein n=1 Tax=Microbacterium sp. RG1 TaxID=2489212 RepID=UPI0010CA4122|nr:hypothetical protein [Microbacterium sp. RG1]QCQ17391.1 hypothetical protein EHF32_12005 [Microbacterium sp. RG1]
MTGSRSTRRSTGLRASLYLMRVDWHLEAVVPASERRRILRSLREEIDDDPRPLEAALGDLGSPRALAARYGEGGRPRPLWSIGVLTALAALFTYWVIFLAFAGGMLAVVDAAAPMSAQARFLFVPVIAFSNPNGIGIGWSGGVEWLVVPAVVVAVALLVGARSWRLFRRTDLA